MLAQTSKNHFSKEPKTHVKTIGIFVAQHVSETTLNDPFSQETVNVCSPSMESTPWEC